MGALIASGLVSFGIGIQSESQLGIRIHLFPSDAFILTSIFRLFKTNPFYRYDRLNSRGPLVLLSSWYSRNS